MDSSIDGKPEQGGARMTNEYANEVLADLKIEVKVNGAAQVAEELGVSEQAVREMVPEEARRHDEATA